MEGRFVYLTEVPAANEHELFADQPDILSTQQVADLLSVAPSTIWREINRGKLACTHVGRCVKAPASLL